MTLEKLDGILCGTPAENRRVRDVISCAQAWREAECLTPEVPEHHPDWSEESCVGENHLEECPVEIALSELLAALNTFEFHR